MKLSTLATDLLQIIAHLRIWNYFDLLQTFAHLRIWNYLAGTYAEDPQQTSRRRVCLV